MRSGSTKATNDRSVRCDSASKVSATHAADPDTLLALTLNGQALAPDHGYPVRLIGPNRPGVMQTKWVTEVQVR